MTSMFAYSANPLASGSESSYSTDSGQDEGAPSGASGVKRGHPGGSSAASDTDDTAGGRLLGSGSQGGGPYKKPKLLDDEGYMSSESESDGWAKPTSSASAGAAAAGSSGAAVVILDDDDDNNNGNTNTNNNIDNDDDDDDDDQVCGSDSDDSLLDAMDEEMLRRFEEGNSESLGVVTAAKLALERASSAMSSLSAAARSDSMHDELEIVDTSRGHTKIPIPQIAPQDSLDVTAAHDLIRVALQGLADGTTPVHTLYLLRTAPIRVLRYHAAALAGTHPYGVGLMLDANVVPDTETLESLGIEPGSVITANIDVATRAWVQGCMLKRKSPSVIRVRMWLDGAPAADNNTIGLRATVRTPLSNIIATLCNKIGMSTRYLALELDGMFLVPSWPLSVLDPVAVVSANVTQKKKLRGPPAELVLLGASAQSPRSQLAPDRGIEGLAPALRPKALVTDEEVQAALSIPAPSSSSTTELDTDKVIIKVRWGKSHSNQYRIKKSGRLAGLLAKARQWLSEEVAPGFGDKAKFIFDGDELDGNESIEDFDMEDGDIIDVFGKP